MFPRISARRRPVYAAPAPGRTGKAPMSRFDGKKVKAVFGGKGFYIALALCLLAAGIVGYYTLLRPQAPAEPASNPTTNVPDDRDNAWVAPAVQPEENVPTAPPAEETPISDPQDLLPQVMSPLDGTTVTVFSVTELMYDETMADWRTHNGIDIRAEAGEAVRAASDGTVTAVRNDPMWGNVVEVTSGEYVMTYAGLSADILVKMDQSIRAGEQLGSVGEVPCELSMEPHLHFDVRSNGEYVDPVSLAK